MFLIIVASVIFNRCFGSNIVYNANNKNGFVNVVLPHPAFARLPLMASVKELDILLELLVFGCLRFYTIAANGGSIRRGASGDLCFIFFKAS